MTSVKDIAQLLEAATAIGIPASHIAKELGLSRQTFFNKCNNKGTSLSPTEKESIQAYLIDAHQTLSKALDMVQTPIAASTKEAPAMTPVKVAASTGGYITSQDVYKAVAQAEAATEGPIDLNALLNGHLVAPIGPAAAPIEEPEELILTAYENKLIEKGGFTLADIIRNRKEAAEFAAKKLAQDNEEEQLPF